MLTNKRRLVKMKSSWNIQKLNNYLDSRNGKPNEVKVLSGEIPIVSKIEFNTGKIYLREDGKSNTKLIKILPKDLVISGINASKGAISLNNYPQEIAATIHYSAYYPKENKCDIIFMWYYFKSNIFQNILKDNLPGGIKTEIKPKHILSLEIPLPPLEEQKRIVAKLKKVEDNIKKIKELIEIQERDIKNLRFSFFEKCKNKYSTKSLSKALELDIDAEKVDVFKEYNFAGVYGFGKGLFVRGIQDGNTSYKVFHKLHKDHIVLSKVKGWEGAIALIDERYDGLYLSPVYPTFKAKENINIKYISEYLQLPAVWQI
ncbi:MAG TPA: hypothetical protein ENL20_04250, partial [Candidatus Cloacimonetes bacterium]|nr:hypothetical protein [Candidatus Cloacimonadota bacterium]